MSNNFLVEALNSSSANLLLKKQAFGKKVVGNSDALKKIFCMQHVF